MEQLPAELCLRIFSLLDYRHVVSAGLVCRSWNFASSNSELWQQLYRQRWGEEQAECFTLDHQKSWKAAYESRDRCDRVGLETTITREGSDYFLVDKGEILHFLGSRKKKVVQKEAKSQGISSNISDERLPKSAIKSADIDIERKCGLQKAGTDVVSERVEPNYPCVGLIDKLIFFIGDLECAMREPKRHRVS